ncbi:hypothetical protein V6N13_105440 [Hibiscus sabdariffa]
MNEFLSSPFRIWLGLNLTKAVDFARDTTDWDLLFSTVLWNLWCQRNAFVFGSTVEEWGSVIVRSKWPMSVSRSAFTTSHLRSSPPLSPQPESTLWTPPPMGWYKLNSDGARSLSGGNAACGGVLHDHHGAWD